jgi:hypothetical protein
MKELLYQKTIEMHHLQILHHYFNNQLMAFFLNFYMKSCTSESKTVVQCIKCKPKIVELKGYGSLFSNFVINLKHRHGSEAAKIYKILISIGPPYKKVKTFVKQLKIKTTQENFKSEIMNFFLYSMIPLRCVKDPYFKKKYLIL